MKTDYDVTVIGLGPAGTLTSLMLSDSSVNVIGIDKEKDIYNPVSYTHLTLPTNREV